MKRLNDKSRRKQLLPPGTSSTKWWRRRRTEKSRKKTRKKKTMERNRRMAEKPKLMNRQTTTVVVVVPRVVTLWDKRRVWKDGRSPCSLARIYLKCLCIWIRWISRWPGASQYWMRGVDCVRGKVMRSTCCCVMAAIGDITCTASNHLSKRYGSLLILAIQETQTGIVVFMQVPYKWIDPYHAAAMLDLKRGWTGINNELKINYAF